MSIRLNKKKYRFAELANLTWFWYYNLKNIFSNRYIHDLFIQFGNHFTWKKNIRKNTENLLAKNPSLYNEWFEFDYRMNVTQSIYIQINKCTILFYLKAYATLCTYFR